MGMSANATETLSHYSRTIPKRYQYYIVHLKSA